MLQENDSGKYRAGVQSCSQSRLRSFNLVQSPLQTGGTECRQGAAVCNGDRHETAAWLDPALRICPQAARRDSTGWSKAAACDPAAPGLVEWKRVKTSLAVSCNRVF